MDPRLLISGNIVKVSDGRVGVFNNFIDKNFGRVRLHGITVTESANLFEPVELTEEILRKAGFVEDCIIDGVFYKPKFPSFKIMRFDNGFFAQFPTPIKINHVHRLQNLFFEIEGEELEINP